MIIIVAALSFAATNGLAQVYEWIDENGERQFSDQKPPEHIEAETKTYKIHNIDSNLPPPVVIDTAKDRRAAQAAQAKQAKQQHLAGQCDKARGHLQKMRGRVSFTDEGTGEPVYVSEKERQMRVAKLTAQIKEYCGS